MLMMSHALACIVHCLMGRLHEHLMTNNGLDMYLKKAFCLAVIWLIGLGSVRFTPFICLVKILLLITSLVIK